MPIEILELVNSAKPTKRFKIVIKEGDAVRSFDFGYKSGTTYIDHADEKKRQAYWARHCGNGTERNLINNFIPSPALFSARLLWGESTELFKNLVKLQEDFNRVYAYRKSQK
jgi:hypothetical protein